MRPTEEKGESAASRPQHVAVMVDEVVALVRALNPLTIIDVTVGAGGHAAALLRATDAHLLGIDRDAAALAAASANLAEFGQRVTLQQADFTDLDTVIAENGFPRVGAIIADLGMSSLALDDAERGFSFRLEGSLDMRMDRRQQLRAYDLVNEESEAELARLIFAYGEERGARRIAREIIETRRRHPIETTGELSRLIEGVVGRRQRGGIHPATRTFQALRIAVNHEMESLTALLDHGPAHLRMGGRMVVLSYHSLEDRPVKQHFRELVREGLFAAVTRKALRPTVEEAARNPRARSARLRCIERIAP